MQKQDKAFSSWLNHVLVPGADEGAAALNDRRLAAVMQGALVACYRWAGEGSLPCLLALLCLWLLKYKQAGGSCRLLNALMPKLSNLPLVKLQNLIVATPSPARRDEQLREVMMRVEGKVDQGQLRLKDEVGRPATSDSATCGALHKRCARRKPAAPASARCASSKHNNLLSPVLISCQIMQALQFHDVAVRDATLGVLLSYHPFWLRLGLEVVTQRAVGDGEFDLI